MNLKNSESFLVVRLGKIFSNKTKSYLTEDPITEIDKTLLTHRTCMFAKFGKKLNIFKIKELTLNSNIYLVIAYKNSEVYKFKTYKIINSFIDIDSKSTNYPAYYNDKESFIGTWLEIEKTDIQVVLSELTVSSSYQKLLLSMGSSMSSFFFCKR